MLAVPCICCCVDPGQFCKRNDTGWIFSEQKENVQCPSLGLWPDRIGGIEMFAIRDPPKGDEFLPPDLFAVLDWFHFFHFQTSNPFRRGHAP